MDDGEVTDLTGNADGDTPETDGDATAETRTVATATGDEEYAACRLGRRGVFG